MYRESGKNSMIIIIDGYNLLQQIFPHVKGRLDKQRAQLIRQLGFYKKERADKIKDIVIVFDGGYIRRATREVRGGVTVIFSGQRMSADDWIADYVERKKGKDLMLVTRDRELIERCKKNNVEVLKGTDFYDIVQSRLLQSVELKLIKDVGDGGVKKYEHDKGIDEIESEALDLLMEQAPVDFYEKEDVQKAADEKKKGRSQTPSKKEKKRIAKIKKL